MRHLRLATESPVDPASSHVPASRIDARFKEYAQYHRTPSNQRAHMIGIPLIVLSLLGLLGRVLVGDGMTGSEYLRVDGGTLLWAVAVLWYLYMDWRLGVPFGFVTLGVYFIGRALPVPALWGLFVLGWVFQFVGHLKYEKKSPAFYKNAEHLLVGPLWVFAKLVGYRRV